MRLGPIVAIVFCVLLVGSAVAGSSPVAPPEALTDASPTTDRAEHVADRCPGGPTAASRERAAEIERGDGPGFVELHPNPTTHGNVGALYPPLLINSNSIVWRIPITCFDSTDSLISHPCQGSSVVDPTYSVVDITWPYRNCTIRIGRRIIFNAI